MSGEAGPASDAGAPILVDSCGWIEVFRGGPLASAYEGVLTSGAALIVPAICVYEVYKRVVQLTGPDKALAYADALAAGEVVPLDATLALNAALLSLRHGLPMADSIVLATADARGATIWTHDPHFEKLPGVHFVRKGEQPPKSRGGAPSPPVPAAESPARARRRRR